MHGRQRFHLGRYALLLPRSLELETKFAIGLFRRLLTESITTAQSIANSQLFRKSFDVFRLLACLSLGKTSAVPQRHAHTGVGVIRSLETLQRQHALFSHKSYTQAVRARPQAPVALSLRCRSMEPTIPSRAGRQPLLRHVSPRPVGDDDQLSESEAHYAHEHDTAHGRPTAIKSKILATCFSFLVLGLMVSTAGAVVVSPVGYLAGALLNEPIHRRFGQRGIAIIAPICQISLVILAASHYQPPNVDLWVFLVIAMVGTFGLGLLHGSWSAWAGGLGGRRNTVEGLLHGSYAVGVGLGRRLASWEVRWWQWWYVLLGAVILQGLLLCWAFRFEDGRRYREESGVLRSSELHEASEVRLVARPGAVLGHAITWICAAYFLVYVGTEAAISGWIFTFMLHARHATANLAFLTYSGFWIGMAAGRILLGPVTDRLGVRRTTPCYLMTAILFQCVFAFVDHVVMSVITVILLGFFFGPLLPSGIVMITGLLPKELHVGAVSFVAFVGQLAAVFVSFLVIPVQFWDIYVCQAIVLAMLAVTLLISLLLFTRLPGSDREGGGLERTGTDHQSPNAAG